MQRAKRSATPQPKIQVSALHARTHFALASQPEWHHSSTSSQGGATRTALHHSCPARRPSSMHSIPAWEAGVGLDAHKRHTHLLFVSPCRLHERATQADDGPTINPLRCECTSVNHADSLPFTCMLGEFLLNHMPAHRLLLRLPAGFFSCFCGPPSPRRRQMSRHPQTPGCPSPSSQPAAPSTGSGCGAWTPSNW